VASGTVGAVTAGGSTLVDANHPWGSTPVAGMFVLLTSGAGAGQFRKISAVSGNTLTLETAWSAPTGTYAYQITPAQEQTSYDADGNAVLSRDALGDPTQGLFDALDRDTGSVDARGGLTQRVRDLAGEVRAVVDAAGNETDYVYDGDGREVAHSEATCRATSRPPPTTRRGASRR
jgi:YD repeat-containing protein